MGECIVDELEEVERKKTLVSNNVIQTETLAEISRAFTTFVTTPPAHIARPPPHVDVERIK